MRKSQARGQKRSILSAMYQRTNKALASSTSGIWRMQALNDCPRQRSAVCLHRSASARWSTSKLVLTCPGRPPDDLLAEQHRPGVGDLRRCSAPLQSWALCTESCSPARWRTCARGGGRTQTTAHPRGCAQMQLTAHSRECARMQQAAHPRECVWARTTARRRECAWKRTTAGPTAHANDWGAAVQKPESRRLPQNCWCARCGTGEGHWSSSVACETTHETTQSTSLLPPAHSTVDCERKRKAGLRAAERDDGQQGGYAPRATGEGSTGGCCTKPAPGRACESARRALESTMGECPACTQSRGRTRALHWQGPCNTCDGRRGNN